MTTTSRTSESVGIFVETCFFVRSVGNSGPVEMFFLVVFFGGGGGGGCSSTLELCFFILIFVELFFVFFFSTLKGCLFS